MHEPDSRRPTDATPTPEPGVTVLDLPDGRSTALHRVVVDELSHDGGETLWVDARNHAASHVLYDLAPTERLVDDVRVARAFTAYQHASLVRELPRRVTPRTQLIVVPAVTALYRDDDVSDAEARSLLDGALELLADLAAAADVPVLCGLAADGDGDDPLTERVRAAADRVVDCRETALGVAYEGDDAATAGYRVGPLWQTTVPYWVDVLGVAEEFDGPASVGTRPQPTLAEVE